MSTPNTHLLRISEIEGRLNSALLNGESTIRIRSELAQARRDHADAGEAERIIRDEAHARRAQIIGEHAATIASQVIESLNNRLAELEAPAGI
jgi:protein involved in temperature-dependent protein secretion